MRYIIILLLLISCGKQVTKTTVVDNNPTLEAKILELESQLAANDETISNLLDTMATLEGENVELSEMVDTLQKQNDKLLKRIKKIKDMYAKTKS